jgi:hypothetical protein
VDGPDVVYKITVSNSDVGVTVEANEYRPSRERVARVEWVTHETGGVHGGTTLERRTGLHIGV